VALVFAYGFLQLNEFVMLCNVIGMVGALRQERPSNSYSIYDKIAPAAIPTLLFVTESGGAYYRLPWSLPLWPGRRHHGSLLQLDDGGLVVIGRHDDDEHNYFLDAYSMKQSNNPFAFATWQRLPSFYSVGSAFNAAVIRITN
jgi:hypothetical protein